MMEDSQDPRRRDAWTTCNQLGWIDDEIVNALTTVDFKTPSFQHQRVEAGDRWTLIKIVVITRRHQFRCSDLHGTR